MCVCTAVPIDLERVQFFKQKSRVMVQSYCSVINLNTHFGATALYVVTRFSLQHLQLIMDSCEPDRSSAYSED